MVHNPENVVDTWIRVGAKRLVLHIESSDDIRGLVERLRSDYGYSKDDPLNIEIGLALNVETPNDEIYEFLKVQEDGKVLIDFVQFMGIQEIGFQGQSFDTVVLEKIAEMRASFPEVIISVDGGVTADNAQDIVDAGANRLISGSAVFESDDVNSTIEMFKNI